MDPKQLNDLLAAVRERTGCQRMSAAATRMEGTVNTLAKEFREFSTETRVQHVSIQSMLDRHDGQLLRDNLALRGDNGEQPGLVAQVRSQEETLRRGGKRITILLTALASILSAAIGALVAQAMG